MSPKSVMESGDSELGLKVETPSDHREDSSYSDGLWNPIEEESRQFGRRGNLKAGIANLITSQILTGKLRMGQRIDQDALANEFEVSRVPVREALILLENFGLVTNISRRGSYVAVITPEDVLDHYEIFGLASGLAARRAAERLSSEQLSELEGLYNAMHRGDGRGDLPNLNFHFHRVINSCSSTRLRSHIRSLGRAMPMRLLIFKDVFGPDADKQHREILEALTSRNADAAADACARHLYSAGVLVVDELRSIGFWDQ